MSAPGFKGGQGRSSESVRGDGTPSFLTLAVFALLLLYLATVA